MISISAWCQAPIIDGHFCDQALWGPPGGIDGCNDANPATADMGNLYFYPDGELLYIGWQRCVNGAGTSNYTIRFDTDCDGIEDSYIYVTWDAIGSACSDIENVYISDNNNTAVLTTAVQGSYYCNSGGNPICSQSGTFLEWVLDMNLVVDQLVNWGVIDPCDCNCDIVELLDGITLSGGSLTSAAKDEFDIFSFVYEYEINDCPDADFSAPLNSCVGEAVTFDGTLTTDNAPSNDTSYYYWIFGDGHFSTDSIPTHFYNTPGNYTVTLTVEDIFGCVDQYSQNITIARELRTSCSLLSPVTCNGLSNGQASTITIGGTPPYIYLWDNGETTSTATMLNQGTHFVTVNDQNGCEDICSVNIPQPNNLLCQATEVNPVVCKGESNGSATVIGSGGNGNYSALWDNGETTQTAISLDAGLHSVTVTDGKGCTTSCSVVINEPPNDLSCSAIQDSPVECNGENNGSATVSPVGGNGNYSYLWDNGETTSNAINLTSGIHVVTVSDIKGCTSSCSVEISEPDLLICNQEVLSNVSCFGLSDGSGIVNPTGGNPPYSFLWSTSENINKIENKPAGTYTVTVSDTKNCSVICDITITQPNILTCSAIEDIAVDCFGNATGQATVSPSEGTAPYTFLWDNNETTATATALNAGVHNVTVTDANNCTTSCSVTINQPNAELACSAVQDIAVDCFGNATGQATVSPSEGTAPYTFLWDNNETTATATALDAGIHNITVTDANNCTTSCSVTINQPNAELACSAVQDIAVDCFGNATGQATVSPSEGTAPYTFLWDNNETTATATALNAGVHNVTVTDANNCTTSCSVTINQPNAELACSAIEDIAVDCFGNATGQATVSPSEGTAPYTFLWDNNETTATATTLNAGIHNVTVTDVNNCTTSCSVTINQPNADLACSAIEDIAVDCFGNATGQATVTPSEGTAPYTFLWDNNETTATATGL